MKHKLFWFLFGVLAMCAIAASITHYDSIRLTGLAGGGSRLIGVDDTGLIVAGVNGSTNNFFGDNPGGNVNHRITLGTNGAIFITPDAGLSGYYFGYGVTNLINYGNIPSFTSPEGFSVSVGANANGIIVTETNILLKGGGNASFWAGNVGATQTGMGLSDAATTIYLNSMGLNASGITNSAFNNMLTIQNLNGADSIIGAASVSSVVSKALTGNSLTNVSFYGTNVQYAVNTNMNYYQVSTADFPTNQIPLGSATVTNFAIINYRGLVAFIATNRAAGGWMRFTNFNGSGNGVGGWAPFVP